MPLGDRVDRGRSGGDGHCYESGCSSGRFVRPHGRGGQLGSLMTASLDHAVWFHNLRPATDWTLHDFRSSGVRRGRGHATGELWNPDGTHVATVTQEVLLRVAR